MLFGIVSSVILVGFGVGYGSGEEFGVLRGFWIMVLICFCG